MADFYDTFTEASPPVLLDNHTPDIGTGWAIIYDGTVTAVYNVKTSTMGAPTTVIGGSTTEAGKGEAHRCNPDPTGAELDVSTSQYDSNWARTNTYTRGTFARKVSGVDTWYASQVLPNGHTKPSLKLWKVVSGTSTELGNYDQTFVNGDVVKLEIRNGTKKVYVNGVERISSTDNVITDAGQAGVWNGSWNAKMDGGNFSGIEMDLFTLTLAGAAPVTIACGLGSVASAGQAVTVVPGAHAVECAAGAIAVAGQHATVQVAAPVIISCGVGAVAAAGQSADAYTSYLAFHDTFTEGNPPVLLENHTPDTGTSWTIIYDTSVTAVVNVKTSDTVAPTTVVGPDTAENNVGTSYRINPDPTGDELIIEFAVYENLWSRANAYIRGAFARKVSGTNTFYALMILPTGATQDSMTLYKVVNGSGTVLGSFEQDFASGDVVRFIVRDDAKIVSVNGYDRITSTDNTIPDAGQAGLWWGEWVGMSGGHMDRRQEIDNYSVWVLGAPPVTIPCAVGTLAAAGQAATVTVGGASPQTISCAAGAIAAAGLGAKVGITVPIQVRAIALAGPGAKVGIGVPVQVRAVALAGPGAKVGIGVPAQVRTLVSAGQTARVIRPTVCAVKAVAVAGQPAAVVAGGIPPVTIACAVGGIVATGRSARAIRPILIACANVTAAGWLVTVSAGAAPPQAIACAVGAIIASGPHAYLSRSVLCVLRTMTFTGYLVDAVPGARAISLASALLQIQGQHVVIEVPSEFTQAGLIEVLIEADETGALILVDRTGCEVIADETGMLTVTDRTGCEVTEDVAEAHIRR